MDAEPTMHVLLEAAHRIERAASKILLAAMFMG
jgi:hypothetical protein